METIHRVLLLLLASLITASSGALLQMKPGNPTTVLSGGLGDAARLYCNAWRLSVEANNAGDWREIPSACTDFVHAYVNGEQFAWDCMVVSNESLSYAKTVNISGDGKDAWVFDFDETLVSNVKYYSICGWNTFNQTCYNNWVNSGEAPALAAVLWLYKELKGLGFQLIIISGRHEDTRDSTVRNLLLAGYSQWAKLIMKEASYNGKSAEIFKTHKRAELEAEGYTIHGNIGDQWSDLLGSPMAKRSFKIPNPMYYTA